MRSALIVIDQQLGIDEPKLGPRNNPHAEDEILKLMKTWRQLEWPIIHVVHRSSDPNSVFWPKQKGFELKTEFKPQKNEVLIEKSVPCAFTGSQLQRTLESLQLDSIVLVGVATNNSIEATARHGGNLGLKVFVVENACFTFDKTDFFGNHHSADVVHAMSLGNLHNEYAQVLSAKLLLETLNIADKQISE